MKIINTNNEEKKKHEKMFRSSNFKINDGKE